MVGGLLWLSELVTMAVMVVVRRRMMKVKEREKTRERS